MILEAHHLTKKFADDVILRDISLTLAPSQSVAIMGDSGVGKSTLLSILGLLLAPTQGALTLAGRDLLALSDREKSRLRNAHFGFLFQSAQLIGSLTALDNVLVPMSFSTQKDLEAEARQQLAQLGLAERLYHYPHQLSIGQKRRVCLARALLLRPQFILADEPTNDLDAAMARQIADYLFDLPGRGCTLLVVTHDEQLARRADRLYRLEEGALRLLT